jgi:hypothetical protein
MRLITLLITVVALAVAAPAIANKGGTPNQGNGGGGGGGGSTPTATPTPTPDATTSGANGKKGDGPSPSIAITSVDGARTTNPQPAHGQAVAFDTVAGSLAGWEYPMVALHCYQSNVLVFVQLNHPDATFTVGGGSSQWTSGDATCNAGLYAYGWKGGKESIRPLASTYDWTAAW